MAKSQDILRKFYREILVGLLVLTVYIPTFIWMWDRWFARDSYYTHGLLIPFISGYLIWQKRKALSEIEIKSSAWGMRLFVLGLLIHLISALFQIYFTSGFSLIVVLIGLVLHFYGSKVLRIVLFPLCFLVFMVPLPMVLIANISFQLKLLAAKISVYVLNNQMRLPCIQDGSTILMRHAQVVVDDVCSGLRSLISLTALGSLFAYWMKGGMIKRSIVFLSTIPIAVLTNVIRILILASVSEIWGTNYARGFLHEFSGFLVFGLAFLLLYIVEKTIE